MKFELHRTTAAAGPRMDAGVTALVDEGIGVLQPTDALSRRPGTPRVLAAASPRLRSRSRTFVQPMGSRVARSPQRLR